MPQSKYFRHFLLLALFAALLAALEHFQFVLPVALTFAVYGALHAVGFIAVLRVHPAALLKKGAFVLLASCLSMLTLKVGLTAGHLLAAISGQWRLPLLLGLSAGIGAVTYLLLIRAFWNQGLTLGWIAAIAIAALLATLLGLQMLGRFPALGHWWLVVSWWCALSAGLWLREMR